MTGRPTFRRASRLTGWALLALTGLIAVLAPYVAPNAPDAQFADRAYAPPTPLRVRDGSGFHAPFIHPQRLHDRLMREYREDDSTRATVSWLDGGRLLSVDPAVGPLLLLGADSLGRDLFARLAHGARWSLGVALLGLVGALCAGALVGALAGAAGGTWDTVLMSVADLVIVLPGAYLVLVLRGVLPLELPAGAIFWLMAGIFAVSAWPHVARGVRAIVATERARDYAEASRAAGAGLLRQALQLLPAARGFLGVETVLLVPAFLVAEATISVLGLGFPVPTPSWGALLQDATNVSVLASAPWVITPAAALFVVTLGLHLALGAGADAAAILRSRS
jgi:peptide/nickel transport system permease protein